MMPRYLGSVQESKDGTYRCQNLCSGFSCKGWHQLMVLALLLRLIEEQHSGCQEAQRTWFKVKAG